MEAALAEHHSHRTDGRSHVGFAALAPLAAASRLFGLGVDLLRQHGRGDAATEALLEAVSADRALLTALCADYLTARAADMAGPTLPLGGHVKSAIQASEVVPPQRQSPSEGAGQLTDAAKAAPTMPAASEPHAAAGQPLAADKAITSLPAVAPQGDGEGQFVVAIKAKQEVPRPVSPSYLAAARRAGPKLFTTALDSVKVRDGRAIGDVPWSGIERLIGANSREAHLLRLVRDAIGGTPADPNTPIRELIDADSFARLHQKAAEHADAQP